jgi:outer membrane protein
VSALYREEAARYAVERIWGELLPEVRLEASYAHRMNPGASVDEQDVASVTGRVNIPLYAGGETHARIRAAKHTHVSRLQEVEQAKTEVMALITQAWSRFQSARAQLRSDKVQVDAFRTALEGTREEEKVGQRTILDVLNAEQELLDAEVQLVSTRREVVVAAFQLLAVMGRLSAAQLHLLEEVYDPDAHYDEVRRKWFGIDITHADGRRETVEAADSIAPGWDYDD